MRTLWELPRWAKIGEKTLEIHTDYRDVLHLLGWLTGSADPTMEPWERWLTALVLFYPNFYRLQRQEWPEAAEYLAWFLRAGRAEADPHAPRLMDWQQDAPLIAAATAKAAGQDLRTLPYLHWWSFLSYYDSISDGGFATVVSIRDKLRRGRKLEPWEQEFYRTHRAEVTLRPPADAEAEREKQRLLALLDAPGKNENPERSEKQRADD